MLYSLLSLDLGGKNTGFFSYSTEDETVINRFESGTVTYDESFVLSQVKRRSKRHSKRNNLRNKFVKRLFLLILQQHYRCKVDVLPDVILGLFNKRGYTYASFELKPKDQEALESDALREWLEEHFGKIKQDRIEQFLTDVASSEDVFKKFTDTIEKIEAPELKGFRVIHHIIKEHKKSHEQGNLPRLKYFEELFAIMDKEDTIQLFFSEHKLDIEAMKNLIGNLSNFQLKELRRYFNDKKMASSDQWVPEKLHKIVWRFIASWHPKQDEETKKRQDTLLQSLKQTDIITFLTQTDPNQTIPPYDDMNNRGAVKCHTLRLNEDYLDQHFPTWRTITHKLADATLKEKLNESTVRFWSKDSTLLHRLLDRSSAIDPYRLRSGSTDGYEDLLSKEEVSQLKRFTQKYYELIRTKVRTGIWTQKDDIFKKCDHNPPYKNNEIHNLVASILGVRISKDQLESFITTLWEKKFGRTTLKGYCKQLEELRKSHGNTFKVYIEQLETKEASKCTKEEKKDGQLLGKIDILSEAIGGFFTIEPLKRSRFANPFSLAQLYTILETQRSGFNKTCRWCSTENQFRAETNTFTDEDTGEVTTYAHCQRLPADTQRPFSGKIERYLDKLGYELAKLKSKELQHSQDNEVKLTIILEQNSFAYEESIRHAKIKNANAKAKKSLEEAKKRGAKSLENKNQRIKNFSQGICLYCGETLGDDGEIDHILPRSTTLKKYGTVFNSEGNLIYVHQSCNQQKRESIYTLDNIAIDIEPIWIEAQIATINNYTTFTALSIEQQRAFKYALFLRQSEVYNKVVSWLRTDQSSRVNGTQKYLAKKIQTKLLEMLPNNIDVEFDFLLADSEDVNRLRKQYAKANKLFTKPEKQPPSSHTIDAVMAFLTYYTKVTGEDTLPSFSKVLEYIHLNNIVTKPLNKIDKDKRGNLGGTAIFKDTIYQEKFAPIYCFEEKVYTGFVKAGKSITFDQCVEVKQKEFDRISEYLDHSKEKANGLVIYTINKQKVLNLFHAIAHDESDTLAVAKILNKFAYNQLKTNVIEAPTVLKQQKKTTTKIYGKNIQLPVYQEWVRFDSAFKKYLQDENIEYREKNGKYDVRDEVVYRFCQTYFNIHSKSIRNKARKVFSLPTVESPSGGFRIARLNHKKEKVYQLVAIDGAKSAGFGLKNGKLDTTVDVPLSTFTQSKRISFKEPEKIVMQEYIDMQQFKDISEYVKIENIKILVAPASTSRPLVRMRMPLQIFLSIYSRSDIHYSTLSDFTFSVDDVDGMVKEKFDALFLELNFAPRDGKFKILQANSEFITIEFSNNNKTVMKYYD
jgi:CRISPR system subtype II-B RNA-guided endonuclease Cas9/Csx12